MEERPTKEDVTLMNEVIEQHMRVCCTYFPGLADQKLSDREMRILFGSLTSTITSLSIRLKCIPTTAENLGMLCDALHEASRGYVLTKRSSREK